MEDCTTSESKKRAREPDTVIQEDAVDTRAAKRPRLDPVSVPRLVPLDPPVAAYLRGRGHLNIELVVPLYLNSKGIRFGRKLRNIDVDLRDYTESTAVSREQCLVFYDRTMSAFAIKNLGRNGIRINGTLYGRGGSHNTVNLADGDVIVIADLRLAFQRVSIPFV